MVEIIAAISMSVIAVCLVIATISLWTIRHGHMIVLAALNGLGETYRLGYEAINLELEKQEQRAAKHEARLANLERLCGPL